MTAIINSWRDVQSEYRVAYSCDSVSVLQQFWVGGAGVIRSLDPPNANNERRGKVFQLSLSVLNSLSVSVPHSLSLTFPQSQSVRGNLRVLAVSPFCIWFLSLGNLQMLHVAFTNVSELCILKLGNFQ